MPELKIYGEITPGMSADVKAVLEAAPPGEELVIRIDSEGGSVFEGFSIYDAIAAYEGPKRSVIESAAFSIASLIALACDEVEITSNGYMMIHNPYAMVEGDDETLARKSDLLSKLKSTMAKVYQNRTGRDENEVLQMMRDESFFNAQEAKAAGLVDTVLARRQETKARITDCKHLPERVVASLWKGGHESAEPSEKENKTMAETKQIPTMAQYRAAFPTAGSDLLVKAAEEEFTMEQMGAAVMRSMQQENEELKAKIAAMEEEQTTSKAMEEEEVVEEETAKAKSGVKPVAQGSQPSTTATQRWKEAVAANVKSGMPKAKAAQAANRQHPGLRTKMLAEANQR